MNTLSSFDSSSYFPMDGLASEWNGRQIGYLIGRSYQTIEKQISASPHLYPSARYESVKHKMMKNIGTGKKFVPKVVQFEVTTVIMSKKDWMGYLLMNKNKFQSDLIKQLKAGFDFCELTLEDKKITYDAK